jgi:hypothetical protein
MHKSPSLQIYVLPSPVLFRVSTTYRCASNVIDIKGRMLNLSAPQFPWPAYRCLIRLSTCCDLFGSQRIRIKLILDAARPARKRVSQHNRLELGSSVLRGVDRAINSHRDTRANSGKAMASHQNHCVVWTPAPTRELLGQCSAKTRVAHKHILGVALFIVGDDVKDGYVLS